MKIKIIILSMVLLATRMGAAQTKESAAVPTDKKTEAAETETADASDGAGAEAAETASAGDAEAEADMPPAPYAAPGAPAMPVVHTDSYQFNETGPLISLERAHQMARKNHPTFKNMDEQIYLADTQIQAAWAMLLPNLSAEAKLIRNRDKVAMAVPNFENIDFPALMAGAPLPPGDEVVIQEKWQPSLNFTANITLFNARSIPLIKYAYDAVELTRLQSQIARNDLLFAVTSSYYQIANLKELVYVYADNVNVAKESLRMAEARTLVGQGTKIDVMRAKIQVKDKERTLADAVDAYYTAKRSLALFIGAKGDFQIVMPRQIADHQKTEATLTDEALESRIELKSAELDVTMARRLAKDTRNKWIPKFDATWKLDITNAGGFSGEKVNWMLIFAMNWSILEGGARLAEKKQRAAEIRMAQNKIDELKLDIKTDVSSKVQEKISKQRNLEVTAELVALAEENHNMISRQYEVGMANSLELTDAANELANQKVMQVLAKLQYELALLTLGKTIGEYSSLALE
ncbi:MAG: TolC family protein [Deltaproteobacteria bacterium]|nr:TolC family protein [Deltaproteobacteria bacterium]